MRKFLCYTINIGLLLCATYGAYYLIKQQDQPEHQISNSVELRHDFTSGIDLKNYAIEDAKNQFLLASDTPSKLRLAFSFTLSKKVRVELTPLYPDWICNSEGLGKAKLSFQGNTVSENWSLVPNKTISFDFTVFNGDLVNVSLTNRAQENCGRVEVVFSEANRTSEYPIIFILIWALTLLFLASIKLPTKYALVGLTFNFLIVFANSTLTTLTLPILINSSLLSFFIVGCLLMIQASIANKMLNHILATLFTLFFLVFLFCFIGYFLLFGAPISRDTIHAVLQSNISETIQFLTSSVGVTKFLVFVFVISIIIKLITSIRGSVIQNKRSALLLSCAMILPTVVNHSQQLDLSPVLKEIVSAKTIYFHELSIFESIRNSRASELAIADASIGNKAQTLVVVIGESANKNHMSLYGYPRKTTPYADSLFLNDDIIRFERAYANHIHTSGALTNALTISNQYNQRKWMSSPSLISIANTMQVETTWITNQQVLGAWDNHVSVLAREAKQLISRNKLVGAARDASKYDEVLVDELEKYLLKNESESNLIFVHLQGSHQSYCRRFPETHTPFKDQLTTRSGFGNLGGKIQRSNNRVVNCYDNSIFYTDSLLDEITALLKKRAEPTAMLYFSDHSEDVINNRAHVTALFSYEMTEIPMFFWASEDWKKTFKEHWNNLKNNRQEIFTNDHIFETLSGLIGIKSDDIQQKNDLSSKLFEPVNDALTLLGRKPINDVSNWHYWQQQNTIDIANLGQCDRLIPHRANSSGKINVALAEGLCGFEIDVFIKLEDNNTQLQIGHDTKTMSESNLESLLENTNLSNLNKIWLDIKNVNDSNISNLVAHLNYLNIKFNLKEIAIIETSYYGESAKKIASEGYKLSYYLPTSATYDSMSLTEAKQKAYAAALENRINVMGASEISFDLKLYPFVKNYLEPMMEPKFNRYHTWFPDDLVMPTPNLLEQLSDKNYFNDSRVKTILLPYHSPYQL